MNIIEGLGMPHALLGRGGRALRRLSILLLFLALASGLGCAHGSNERGADRAPGGTPESVGLSSVALARLDALLDAYVERGDIPGYQLMVARHGQVVHERVQGLLEVETDRPLESDSIYRIYSMSKVITGVATMIAYEQGGFLLNEPISKYLPPLANPRVMKWRPDGTTEVVPATREIKILDLLRHTSGISYSFLAPPPLGDRYVEASLTPGLRGVPAKGGPLGPSGADDDATLEDMVERLGKLPLVADPGTIWHYGINMDVLGRLIEVSSGQSFPAFLEERLFAPLDMQDTAFFVPETKVDRFAASYLPAEGGGLELLDAPRSSEYRTPPAMPGGGGGLVSTARDYMRFALMLLGRGELDGVRVLSPQTVDLMMSNHLPEALFGPNPMKEMFSDLYANDALGVGFGLTGSVIVEPALTGLAVSKGTFGWGGAASTFFWVDPEEDIAVVFMTQLVPSRSYPLRPELMKGVSAAIIGD